MSEGKLRLVQWAPGIVGKAAMRTVIRHPDLELIGVRVYSQAKEGMDAGDICGLPATGVKAIQDLADFPAAKSKRVADALGGLDYV